MDSLKIPKPDGYGVLAFAKIGKHRVILLEDWTTPFGTIPRGFISDGASIPRLLWWFSHPFAELLESSIVHDWHYDNAIGTKDIADAAFKQVATDYSAINNTTRWKISVASLLVRKFGRGAY